MKLKKLLLVSFTLLLACIVVPLAAQKPTHRVLFALTSGDAADWHMTLANIQNLIAGLDSTQVEVVAYGPGIAFVQKDSTAAAAIKLLEQKHVQFVACGNAMHARNLTQADLIEGVTVVPAGIVEVITRQEQGWTYIKAGR